MTYSEKIQEIFGVEGCPKYCECVKNVKYNGTDTICKYMFDRARVGENYGRVGIPKIVMVGKEGFPDKKVVKEVSKPA